MTSRTRHGHDQSCDMRTPGGTAAARSIEKAQTMLACTAAQCCLAMTAGQNENSAGLFRTANGIKLLANSLPGLCRALLRAVLRCTGAANLASRCAAAGGLPQKRAICGAAAPRRRMAADPTGCQSLVRCGLRMPASTPAITSLSECSTPFLMAPIAVSLMGSMSETSWPRASQRWHTTSFRQLATV